MAKNDVISVENNITKKDFRKVFWRSFTLLGSFNYEKMEGLAYLYCIEHILKKIYKDDEEGLKQAMLRESAAFNDNCTSTIRYGNFYCDGRKR